MTGRRVALLLAVLASVPVGASPPCLAEMRHGAADAAAMEMHHLHILLNHGITMVAQGTNLVMLAGMRATPALDAPTLRHGQMMIAEGRDLIRRSLEAPQRASGPEGGQAASALLRYSRELADAIAVYMKHLEKLDVDRMSSRRTMALQRMNIILNHSLEMASEGANLVMVARMDMAGKLDGVSLEHGKRMISHAGHLCRETVEGEAMKNLRDFGMAPEDEPMMELTRKLAADVSKIIVLLARMPP